MVFRCFVFCLQYMYVPRTIAVKNKNISPLSIGKVGRPGGPGPPGDEGGGGIFELSASIKVIIRG